MHYAPLLLASALAAALVPAQAQPPIAEVGPQAGTVLETMEAAAVEAWRVAGAPVTEVALPDVEPLPQERKPQRLAEPRFAPVPVGSVRLAQAQTAPAAQPPARPAARAAAPVPAARAATESNPNTNALRPCSAVTVDQPTTLTLGKSQVVRLPFPVQRLIVGGAPGGRAGRAAGAPGSAPTQPGGAPAPAAGTAPGGTSDGVAEADVTLLSPTELFFLGRHTGSMNVVLQGSDGRCLVKDLVVTVDPSSLQAKVAELMPEESEVRIRGAEGSLVLTGNISDPLKLQQLVTIASTYTDPKKVVNLMRVTSPMQVMLEVKIAEVSKTLLDRFGLDFSRVIRSGPRFSVFSGIFGGERLGAGTIRPRPDRNGEFRVPDTFPGADLINSANGSTQLGIDAQRQDGIIRVLAEPNIMAVSGQQASFLSGGKIFIPVAQAAQGAGTVITLEEKEFGVGLKFTPTVLDGRISLKVVSEVSELSQTGTPFTTVGGVTAVLPSLSTRRVDTTVQLIDGQSFAVAGLIRNNFTEALSKFPGLGETPVVGALFRSSEFQSDQTELLFVVTPRLVKPISSSEPITLPTDNHVMPSRSDVHLQGSGEGSEPAPAQRAQQPPAAVTAPVPPATPATQRP